MGQFWGGGRAKQAYSMGEANVLESQLPEESPAPSLMPLRLEDMTTGTHYYTWAQKPKPMIASLHQPDDALILHIPLATPWLYSHSGLNSQPIPSFCILLLPSTLSSWKTKHLHVGVMQRPVPGVDHRRAISFVLARKGIPAAPCIQLWRVSKMHSAFIRELWRTEEGVHLSSSLETDCV